MPLTMPNATLFVGPARCCRCTNLRSDGQVGTAGGPVASVLEVFTRNAPYVGAFGNGTRMKFVANHLVAIYNVAVAESITFARKMGLEAQQGWDLFAASPIIGNGVFRLGG